MRRVLLLALWVAACVTQEDSTSPLPPQVARIATWNIEWFSKGGPKPRTTQSVRNTAEQMLRIRADVWALQEIDSDGILQDLVKLMPGYACKLGTIGNQQFCGIIYNTQRATLLGWSAKGVEEVALGRQGLRSAPVAYLRIGKFDFYLLPVHFKAGMSNARDGMIRLQQATALANWLRKKLKSGPEQDYIVAGDFNDVADSDWLKPLRSGELLTFVPIASEIKSTETKYQTAVDGIAYTAGTKREIIAKTGKVWGETAGDSDHLAFSAQFRTGEDDD
jgi:endonuclease/exonuclease/phosphatase family metal-dependent hydrolase